MKDPGDLHLLDMVERYADSVATGADVKHALEVARQDGRSTTAA